MNPKLTGEVTVTFIRGGISSKSGKPYLQISNGRAELFVNIPKEYEVDDKTFVDYSEDDMITLEVETIVGSDTVKLLSLV